MRAWLLAPRRLPRLPRAFRLLVFGPLQICASFLGGLALYLLLLWIFLRLTSPPVCWILERRLETVRPAGEPRLDTLREQIGQTRTSAAARRFEQLSAAAGIDLAPAGSPGRSSVPEEVRKEREALRNNLKLFCQERRARADDEWMIEPEGVRAWRATPAFRTGRAFLLSDQHLVWQVDPSTMDTRQQLDIVALLTWARLLTLEAMENGREGRLADALESLEAAWRIRQAFGKSPVLVSQLLVIVVEQEVESALRLLDNVPQLWDERLARCNHPRLLNGGLRSEVLTLAERWRATELLQPRLTFLIDPIIKPQLLNLTYDLELVVSRSAALSLKETTPERLGSVWDRKSHFLDIAGRIIWPDLRVAVFRSLRLTLQHELTVLVLRARRGESLPSFVSSSSFPGEGWIVTSDREGHLVEIHFSRRFEEQDEKAQFKTPLRFVRRRGTP